MIGDIVVNSSGKYLGTVSSIEDYGTDESRLIIDEEWEIMMCDIAKHVINLSDPCFPPSYFVVM